MPSLATPSKAAPVVVVIGVGEPPRTGARYTYPVPPPFRVQYTYEASATTDATPSAPFPYVSGSHFNDRLHVAPPQSWPQLPQLFAAPRSVSQPSSAVAVGCKQSPKPLEQTGAHVPFVHDTEPALPYEQACLQAPQLAASLCTSTSQPFLPSPSQSRCVPSQLGLHEPEAQARAVVPVLAQAMVQPPQWSTSLPMSTSQPFDGSSSQSTCVASQGVSCPVAPSFDPAELASLTPLASGMPWNPALPDPPTPVPALPVPMGPLPPELVAPPAAFAPPVGCADMPPLPFAPPVISAVPASLD